MSDQTDTDTTEENPEGDENVVDFEEASSQVRQIVQLEGKDQQEAIQLINEIKQLQHKLGALVREFESQKQELLDDIGELQEDLENMLEKVRYKYDAPEEEYIFNFPGNGQPPRFVHQSCVGGGQQPTGSQGEPLSGESETED